MKSLKLSPLVLFPVSLLLTVSCSLYPQDIQTTGCNNPPSAPGFSKSAALRSALEELTHKGVPGVSMAVYSSEGMWTGAAGLARIEDKAPMEPCHLHFLQSVSKTYMAVAILKLHEESRLNLDAAITTYLPERFSRQITDAERITVRMLLNHTSGVPEYNFDPRYITFLLQHPDHIFQPEEYLEFIDGKALDFEPGSKYSYRNSNYVILALIGDAVSGDHARLIADVVFKPLGLNQTFYRNTPNYVHHPNLVNSYWDRYGNGVLENASTLQRSNVASMAGDDGIITTPYEAVLFLKGLMEGKLISERTLAEMMTWVTNKENQPAYGLGLDYTTVNGYVAYGHGGAGLGAGCELFYFPEKGLYSFVTLNLGIVTESSLHARAEEAKNAIYDALLK